MKDAVWNIRKVHGNGRIQGLPAQQQRGGCLGDFFGLSFNVHGSSSGGEKSGK
jgi:hypothetical protein